MEVKNAEFGQKYAAVLGALRVNQRLQRSSLRQ
jgi:hypothetical protein